MLVKSCPSPIFQGTTCFDSWKDAVVPGHTDLWAMQRLREQSRPIEERRYRFCPLASLGTTDLTGSYWILLAMVMCHMCHMCHPTPSRILLNWWELILFNGRHTFDSVQEFSLVTRRFVKHIKRRDISIHIQLCFSACQQMWKLCDLKAMQSATAKKLWVFTWPAETCSEALQWIALQASMVPCATNCTKRPMQEVPSFERHRAMQLQC